MNQVDWLLVDEGGSNNFYSKSCLMVYKLILIINPICILSHLQIGKLFSLFLHRFKQIKTTNLIPCL